MRSSIYNGSSNNISILNRIAEEMAKRHNISFIDLNDYFITDWEKHHMRFEFLSDGHWNERGHQIAARAIKDYVNECSPNYIDGCVPSRAFSH